MANNANLKADYAQIVRNNDNQEITGDALQSVLDSIVDAVGANYSFVGVAIPSTAPGLPDQNIFYLASAAGTYSNFGSPAPVLTGDNLYAFCWNGSWTSINVGALTSSAGKAHAKEIIALHNPNYTFVGFASTATPTPSVSPTPPAYGSAWIAVNTGTIFGLTGVIEGQIVWYNGSAFVAETIMPFAKSAAFLSDNFVEYNSTTKIVSFPAGLLMPPRKSNYRSVSATSVDCSSLSGFATYIIGNFTTGALTICRYDDLYKNLYGERYIVACLYGKAIIGDFNVKIDGKEFGITTKQWGSISSPSPILLDETARTLTFPSSCWFTSPDRGNFVNVTATTVDLSSLNGTLFYIYFDVADNLPKAVAASGSFDDRLGVDHYVIASGYLTRGLNANFTYLRNGIAALPSNSVAKSQLNFPPIVANSVKNHPFQKDVNGTLIDDLRATILDVQLVTAYDPAKFYSFAEVNVNTGTPSITFILYSSTSASAGVSFSNLGSFVYTGSLTETNPVKLVGALGTILIIPNNWKQTGNTGQMWYNGYGLSDLAFKDVHIRSLSNKSLDTRVSVLDILRKDANGTFADDVRAFVVDMDIVTAYNPALFYSIGEINVNVGLSRIQINVYSTTASTGGGLVLVASFVYIGSLTETTPQVVPSVSGGHTIVIIPNNWKQTGNTGSMWHNRYGLTDLPWRGYKRSAALANLDTRMKSIEATKNPRIVLPSKLIAVVGKEYNLYWDAIALLPEVGLGEPQYIFDVTCSKGVQHKRGFRITPVTGDIGTYSFVLNVYDNNQILIATKTVSLIIVAAAVNSSGKQLLLIGDSTTDDTGRVATTLQANFAAIANTPNFLGSHGATISSIARHEARSGKTYGYYARGVGITTVKFTVTGTANTWVRFWANYVDAATNNGSIMVTEKYLDGSGNGHVIAEIWAQPTNPIGLGWFGTLNATGGVNPTLNVTNTEILTGYTPFKNSGGIGTLDVAAYMTRFGQTGDIDIFDMDLGINDSAGGLVSEANRTQIINDIKSLATAVLTTFPSCKVLVNLPKSNCSTRSNAAGPGTKHDVYRINLHRLRELIVENFDNGVYNANVVVTGCGLNIDRYFGYPVSNAVAGSRYAETIPYHTDEVHPRAEGYDQMADSKFASIIYYLNL